MLAFTPHLLAPPPTPVAASALDAATTAWVNAVVSAGGTVSGTQQTRVDTLIKALKAGGNATFSTLDGLWLFGGESSTQQSTIDLANLNTLVYHGTPTFATQLSAAGLLGDGSTVFCDSQITLSTATHFAQNSGTIGCYMTAADSAGGMMMGAQSAGWATIQNSSSRWASGVNVAAGDFAVISTGLTGLGVCSRTNSTATGDPLTVFNSSFTSGTSNSGSGDLSQAPPALKCYFLANDASGPNAPSNGKMAAAFIASGWTSGQITAFATALNAYMTSWTISAY